MPKGFFLFCYLLLISFHAQALDVNIPSPSDNHVNDFATILDQNTIMHLRNQLREIETTTGVEISIAIISSKQSVGYVGAIEPLATRWFDVWKVGNLPKNNGILVLVALFDREVRIEMGKSYGHKFDSEMKTIIDDDIIPAFKRQKYAEGITSAVSSLSTFAQQQENPPSGFARITQKLGHFFSPWWMKLLAFIGALFAAWRVFQHQQRFKARQCQQCLAPLARLSEQVEDRYLSTEQKAEEKVGSVDYDVWKCTRCSHFELVKFSKLFRKSSACPKCRRQTALNQSSTHTDDTITEYWSCQNCKHTFQRYRAVSSGSNGSSGNFGGGSSGGGGASGSW